MIQSDYIFDKSEKPRTVSARDFFHAWNDVCNAQQQKERLIAAWDSSPDYTSEIFHVPNAVLTQLALRLKLEVYSGYYSIDAVFIENGDRVHCAPPSQNWFQNIRIAFEHENFFRSGLFQEVSHLLITRADLRVLVSYPNNDNDLNTELDNLATIISNSGLGNSDPAFLLITGTRNDSKTEIEWNAYTYQGRSLLPLEASTANVA